MHPIRHFIIKVAEVVAYLAIIILTLIGGVSGWVSAIASETSKPVGIILGAVAGFVIAATFSAILFLLVDIAEKTRRRGS
jgi:hypothetical protein